MTGAISVTTANDAITFNHKIGRPDTDLGIWNSYNPRGATTALTLTTRTANGTITLNRYNAINTNTADLNFNGATYSFDGSTTITAASGQI